MRPWPRWTTAIFTMLVSVSGLSIAQAVASPTKAQTDWTQYQFDASRTGANPFESILSPTTVGALSAVWKAPTQGQVNGNSIPVEVAGTVFVGDGQGNVQALDAATGSVLWRNNVGGNFIANSMAAAGGVVYVGACNDLWAFRASDGAFLWQSFLGSGFGSCDVSSPAYVDGVLYAATTSDKHVHAVRASDGVVLWNSETLSGEIINVSAPAVANGLVYVTQLKGRLSAFPAGCSTPCPPVWTADTGAFAGDPMVVGGLVSSVPGGSSEHSTP